MKDMNLDVYNTHMELYPYTKGDYPIIEKDFTSVDKFTGSDIPCGYIIDDGKLFLPRGASISKIERLCDLQAKYSSETDPYEKMNRQHYSLYDPKDELQEASIKFLQEPGQQKSLTLKTGYGKTFVVAYTSTALSLRTLIITPNERLKQQWIQTYHKMFDYRPRDLMNIEGSNVINGIMEDMYDECDVYFVNHQTIRSYANTNNGYMLHKFFKKLKIGIKVYDESHMEFANIIHTDFYSNTDKTWYLSATFSRSDKTEAECFKRAFNSVDEFGYVQSSAIQEKHVIYHSVKFNSHIAPKNRYIAVPFNGMTGASYGKYAFFIDPNDTAYNIILKELEILRNVEGKILIFVPLIDAVDSIVTKLKKDFSYKSVAAYHSRISKDDKESAMKKDIIVSTIKSCGTGVDIPGLRAVICSEPISSKVVAEQMFGRIRRYKSLNDKGEEEFKDTYFFDNIDVTLVPCVWWWRSRFKKYESLAKNVIELDMDH